MTEFRSFLLGIGVGAEYPCGSVSASEQSEEPGISKKAQHRWFALATSESPVVLSCWVDIYAPARYYDRLRLCNFSIRTPCVILDVSTNDFRFLFGFHLINYDSFGSNHLRAVWRLSLGLGVVPALAVLIWRLNMDEPVRYRKDSMKHAKIPYWLVLKRYGGSLAAISFTW